MTTPTNHPNPMPAKPENPPHGPSGVTRPSISAPSQGPGTNTGHGHIWKRPDRMVARCGGPALCSRCKADQAAYPTDDPLSPVTDQARRYLTAVHGPDWHYRAPEQFPNLVEQWIWALAAADLNLAEKVMTKLETMAAESPR